MAAAENVVVVRRTISQTLVPYKEVEEKLLLRRFGGKNTSHGVRFCSTNNVSSVQDGGTQSWRDSKRVHFNERTGLERSRSEVCLRRKSSYVRETSLDDYQERQEEVRPILRRREKDSTRRISGGKRSSRPQSDFFPEFEVQFNKGERSIQSKNNEPEQRLGQSIATLRREMASLRRQDRQLYDQMACLNEHIKDLKELSRMRGGLFVSRGDEEGSRVSREDEGNIKGCLNTDSPKEQINNSRTRPIKVSLPRERACQNNDRRTSSRSSMIEKNIEMENKDGVRRVQETSFEYFEEPSRVSAVPPQAPVKKSGKPTKPTTSQVTRKTTVHLSSKSISCQFLNSSTATRGKRNSYVENSESANPRYSTSISERQIRDSINVDSKQRSLSMSHLKRVTKIADASTSDSECSTSGCYGGSSTGSELDLERSVTYSADLSADEGHGLSPNSKVCELKLKPEKQTQGYQYISAAEAGHFRKQIVSV